MIATALAPAKVNLFLHVGPLQPDGYHPLASLMSFADLGDRLDLSAASTTAFEVDGPFAAALAAEDPQRNLAWRAVQALLARTGVAPPPFRLRLVKALPVAAGLGGGSSDAGAALRLVRDVFAPEVDDSVLQAIAADLGADGPACLTARPMLARGRGELLSPPPPMPVLDAVLVNPGQACPTGAVYRAYDVKAVGEADLPQVADLATFEAVAGFLARCRNDLQRPALAVAPAIADVLDTLAADPDARLARLSGSGATCFALCADAQAAARLAHRVEALKPSWWVRACRLGGPWPDGTSPKTAGHEPVNARNLPPVAA